MSSTVDRLRFPIKHAGLCRKIRFLPAAIQIQSLCMYSAYFQCLRFHWRVEEFFFSGVLSARVSHKTQETVFSRLLRRSFLRDPSDSFRFILTLVVAHELYGLRREKKDGRVLRRQVKQTQLKHGNRKGI